MFKDLNQSTTPENLGGGVETPSANGFLALLKGGAE